MNFFQFFVWGIWLISIEDTWGKLLVQLRREVVCRLENLWLYGLGSLFMPALLGIIADKNILVLKSFRIAILRQVLQFILQHKPLILQMYWVILQPVVLYANYCVE
jgi:NHS family xanthosine MFS transporter